jgi:threonine dehydratase
MIEKLTLRDVQKAADRIRGISHVTPILTSSSLNQLTGNDLFCKGEHLQKVGAFKFRGAFNAVSRLDQQQLDRGLITVSSGNHAQALALAGRLHHAKVHIVMPDTASGIKKEAVKSYGADIHWCGNLQTKREKSLAEIKSLTGAHYIPPYDHPDVIAGQGTVALEMLDQIADLDVLVAPVGGGGLIAGIALVAKSMCPGIKVYGAEPLGADDAARSLSEGRRLPQLNPQTIADGLQTGIGEWNWHIIKDQVDDILTVNDQEIIDATHFIWERMKQVVEPSGAVSLAMVMSDEFRKRHQGQRIGLVFSGGNVSLDFFQCHKQS